MSSPSLVGSLRRYSVPLVVSLVVAVTVVAVPPIVLGGVTTRTYAITAAVLILAVGAVLPYAVFVAAGTLPLLYAGVASFTAPETGRDTAHPFSAVTALRHVAAGFAYVVGSAAVGAVGIGAQIGMEAGRAGAAAPLGIPLLYLGGGIVGAVFVCLQLWRYDVRWRALERRTVLGTTALGGLLALSPVVAFAVFNGGLFR